MNSIFSSKAISFLKIILYVKCFAAHAPCAFLLHAQRPEKCVTSPGTRVTDGC